MQNAARPTTKRTPAMDPPPDVESLDVDVETVPAEAPIAAASPVGESAVQKKKRLNREKQSRCRAKKKGNPQALKKEAAYKKVH